MSEAKVADLLGDRLDTRLEASGVCAHDGAFYVIFDNSPGIARIAELVPMSGRNDLLSPTGGAKRGFEDIAYDRVSNRFYLLLEAVEQRRGVFMAMVQEHDEGGQYLGAAPLDFALAGPNKGLEGLTCIQRAGETYLLGLCEGNGCKDGAAGRKPGQGRIQVFSRGRRRWKHVDTIRLPTGVTFEDYASLAVSDDRIAVVSQASSALWIGALLKTGFNVRDGGTIYGFPRDAAGDALYCNIEGVSWVDERLVMVSDRAKTEQGQRCQAKEQAIHLFAVPGRADMSGAPWPAAKEHAEGDPSG